MRWVGALVLCFLFFLDRTKFVGPTPFGPLVHKFYELCGCSHESRPGLSNSIAVEFAEGYTRGFGVAVDLIGEVGAAVALKSVESVS
jgi:hypothetical protein